MVNASVCAHRRRLDAMDEQLILDKQLAALSDLCGGQRHAAYDTRFCKCNAPQQREPLREIASMHLQNTYAEPDRIPHRHFVMI